ncbi:short chain dehydrogenase [Xylaria digitata]|nr:short chain dehydrogenase [Xylaria digitata]
MLENDPSVSELRATNSEIVEIDYEREDTIVAAVKALGGTDLDVLVNCAGIKPRPLEWDAHHEADLMERFQVMPVTLTTTTLAIDFKTAGLPVTTMAIDPGFIKTRLTGFRGTVDIKESSNGMYKLIESLTPEMSGSFYKWNGKELP